MIKTYKLKAVPTVAWPETPLFATPVLLSLRYSGLGTLHIVVEVVVKAPGNADPAWANRSRPGYAYAGIPGCGLGTASPLLSNSLTSCPCVVCNAQARA